MAEYVAEVGHTHAADGRMEEVESRERAVAPYDKSRVEGHWVALVVEDALWEESRRPAGFDWHRDGDGWRCNGGSHYVSTTTSRRSTVTWLFEENCVKKPFV